MPGNVMTKIEPTNTTGGGTGYECKTILFNCSCHSFEDVASQLVKAIHCTYAVGMQHATQVHTKGKAIVYNGHFERCEAVASVLAAAGLNAIVER